MKSFVCAVLLGVVSSSAAANAAPATVPADGATGSGG